MTRGSFGKTTIVERAGLVVPDRYRELLPSNLRSRAYGRGASYTSSTVAREPPKLGKLVSGNPAAVPLFSLRLGHARVLIVHRTIIHYARAASLPDKGRLKDADAEFSLRLGHARVLTSPRDVIHCARAASLRRPLQV